MTRDPITDPEILADLHRRNASEREPGRTRPLRWAPPAIVEHWPCKSCSVMVGMTRDAIDLHAMFNRQLERRREQPLPRRGLCEDCKRRDEELVAAQRRPHEQQAMSGMDAPKATRDLHDLTNRRRST